MNRNEWPARVRDQRPRFDAALHTHTHTHTHCWQHRAEKEQQHTSTATRRTCGGGVARVGGGPRSRGGDGERPPPDTWERADANGVPAETETETEAEAEADGDSARDDARADDEDWSCADDEAGRAGVTRNARGDVSGAPLASTPLPLPPTPKLPPWPP